MGLSKSKHVYAFQPLPWPEALTAFRLIDQICGIANTYATTHLDKYATVVLEKVNELQRLPYLWDAFEADFERVRGTHLVRLASELHNVLEKLEGCKYDMGMLASKDLTFKSQRKAADKVLTLLREVEEAHRAFHYAFELALYASMREEEEARNGTARLQEEPPEVPDSPARPVVPVTAGDGADERAVTNLRQVYQDAAAADARAAVAAPPPLQPPPEAEESWLHDDRSTSAASHRRPVSPVRPAVRQLSREIEEAAVVSPRVQPASPTRRPRTADASTMARSAPPPPPPLPPPPPAEEAAPPPARSRSMPRNPSTPRSSLRYDSVRQSRDQQYIVMYIPQGPDGGGPRAILVPANALQPAPSPPPGTAGTAAATTVTGGVSPFATNTRVAYAALPTAPTGPPMASPPTQHVQMLLPTVSAVAPAQPQVWAPQYLTTPSSPVVPPQPQLVPQQQQQQQQQQQTMTYTYLPTAPPPAPPSPQPVPYKSPAAASHRPSYRASAAPPGPPLTSHLTHTFSAGSNGSVPYTTSYTSPRTSSRALARNVAPSSSYRYFSPPPAPLSPPSLHTLSSAQQGFSSTGLPYDGIRSPALSMTASGTPDLNAYFDRPALSGGGSSGGWLSSLAAPAPAAVGGAAAVVPAAAPAALPSGLMMLQPVAAATTSATGTLLLQPQSSPTQPPMLVMAATQPRGVGGGIGTTDVGGRTSSSNRVRFLGRDGVGGVGSEGEIEYDVDGGHEGLYDDDDVDQIARSSGGTNRSLHTYDSYSAARRGASRRATPSYLAPYYGEDARESPSYGSGLVNRRDAGDRISRRTDVPRGGRRRVPLDDFEDGVDEFSSDEPPPVMAAPPRQRRPSYTSAATVPPPRLVGSFSRDAEMDILPLTAAAAAAAAAGGGGGTSRQGPQRSGSGRAAPLSYERLAALAGLDPELLGGGAAAGLAATATAQPYTRPSAAAPRKAPGAAAAAAAAVTHIRQHPNQHPSQQLVPGETSLRRAELLSEAVEGGDWAAAVELAALVRTGWWNDPRDGAVARGLLMQAALRGGSADAHAALGHMAERGEGQPGGNPDLAAAARHYEAAAAGGHRDATTAFAYLLEHGLGVPQDEVRAAQLYAAAAQRNCSTAANNLAKMILDGRGAVAAATAAAAATGSANGADASPAAMARSLFKRAARAGSASAWYNLGVCYLQQLKQRSSGAASGGGALAATVREDMESEALKCFGEAARKGHPRAALRAGYLHLQRSEAAAAVDAFCTAVLNAAAAAAAAPPAGGAAGAASERLATGPTADAAAAAAAMEAEALWCLAQLAERQAAVLEVRTTAAAPPPAAKGGSGRAVGGRGSAVDVAGGSGSGSGGDLGGGLRRQTTDADGDAASVTGLEVEDERDGDGDGEGQRGRGGGGGGGAAGGAAGRGAEDDASSTRTGGTANRAVNTLLSALADNNNTDAAVAGAAAAAAAAGGGGAGGGLPDDPAAAAALRFARQICRLDFSCCHRPAGHLPFTSAATAADTGDTTLTAAAAAAAAAAPVPIRGLRRLRRQAREVLAEDAGAVATPGSLSETSSIDGGGAAAAAAAGGSGAGPMAAALARLELELQQPAERARVARRAAAELMAAAAALGHAAAQHWLAGWRWSLGQRAAAVALWESAGRRGHGASLMVLGQMAEGGQLTAATDDGASAVNGADLAAAAQYYLRAQEVGTPGAVEAMRRVQKLLQRHVTLQGKLEAVAAGGRAGGGGGCSAAGLGAALGSGTTSLGGPRASLGRRP